MSYLERLGLVATLIFVGFAAQANDHEHLTYLPSYEDLIRALDDSVAPTPRGQPVNTPLSQVEARVFDRLPAGTIMGPALVRSPRGEQSVLESIFGPRLFERIARRRVAQIQRQLSLGGATPTATQLEAIRVLSNPRGRGFRAEVQRAFPSTLRSMTFAEMTRVLGGDEVAPAQAMRAMVQIMPGARVPGGRYYLAVAKVRAQIFKSLGSRADRDLRARPFEYYGRRVPASRRPHLDVSVPFKISGDDLESGEFSGRVLQQIQRALPGTRMTFQLTQPRRLMSQRRSTWEESIAASRSRWREQVQTARRFADAHPELSIGIDISGSAHESSYSGVQVAAVDARRSGRAIGYPGDRHFRLFRRSLSEAERANPIRAERRFQREMIRLHIEQLDEVFSRFSGRSIRIHAFEGGNRGAFYQALWGSLQQRIRSGQPMPSQIRIGHVAALAPADIQRFARMQSQARTRGASSFNFLFELNLESNRVVQDADVDQLLRRAAQIDDAGFRVALGTDGEGIFGQSLMDQFKSMAGRLSASGDLQLFEGFQALVRGSGVTPQGWESFVREQAGRGHPLSRATCMTMNLSLVGAGACNIGALSGNGLAACR